MTPSTRRGPVAAILLLTLLAITSSCGGDDISRDDFISQLSAVTGGPDQATPEVAGCIYDQISSDRRLLIEASKPSKISKQDSQRLTSITKSCALGSGSTAKHTTTTRS